MMSAFLLRELVSSAIAWAIARSSSRSLRSSTDRSSCCSAAISHLARLRPRSGSVSPDAKGHGTEGKGARRDFTYRPPTLSNKSPSGHRLATRLESLSPATPRGTRGRRCTYGTGHRGLVGNNTRTVGQYVPGPDNGVRDRSPDRTLESRALQDRVVVGVDRGGHRDLADGQVGVLEAVAGQHAHNGGAGGTPTLSSPATDAAEAASQKTDSSEARNR